MGAHLQTAMDGLSKEQHLQEERLGVLQASITTSFARQGPSRIRDEVRTQVEYLERRLREIEERVASVSKLAASASPMRSLEGYGLVDPTPCTAASSAGQALMAVQELELLLRDEMKAVHRNCMTLQEAFDERVTAPLQSFEQRLTEHDQKVKQCIDAGQDVSSRVEEHEFRLGVTRTKLEMHDQKLISLDHAFRWIRRADIASGDMPESARACEPCPAKDGGSHVRWWDD